MPRHSEETSANAGVFFIAWCLHNLIVGQYQTYSSYGGLVAGYSNSITGVYASVLGGNSNTASGQCAAVGGGFGNKAMGSYASVVGGQASTASATYGLEPVTTSIASLQSQLTNQGKITGLFSLSDGSQRASEAFLYAYVVIVKEEEQIILVHQVSLGKRQRAPHKPPEPLAQRVVKTLHMTGLSLAFTRGSMLCRWQHIRVSAPKVGEQKAFLIPLRDALKEQGTSAFASVPDGTFQVCQCSKQQSVWSFCIGPATPSACFYVAPRRTTSRRVQERRSSWPATVSS